MKITTGKGQVEYYFVVFPTGRNYFRGIGDTLHLKNQSEQLPEPSNSPRNWKKNEKPIKTERFPKKVLWSEMKGIWKKKKEI